MVEQKDLTSQSENQEAKQEKTLTDLKKENETTQIQIDQITARNPEIKNSPEYQEFTRLDAGVDMLKENSMEAAREFYATKLDTHKNLTLLEVEMRNSSVV
jgi:hypothetical protein